MAAMVIDNVGELKRFLESFMDECALIDSKGEPVSVEYLLLDGEGCIRILDS
jgi:hypothetical protein